MILAWSACQDDENYFNASLSTDALAFHPIPGGAVMHYRLPANADVASIRVRYKDFRGEKITRTGSSSADSLELVGFNEARQGVVARVSLCDRDDVESMPLEVTFDTRDSGPVAFFSTLECQPSWGGFRLTFDLQEKVNGMAHVFYVGEDPRTKLQDTLLISSFVLKEGADTLFYSLQQERPEYDVVVRTEDFRGYMAKEKVWSGVKPLLMEKLEVNSFDFHDPLNLSIEDPSEYHLGYKYLFDNDTKGEGCLGEQGWANFSTYVAGPHVLGKPLFVIDMKEERLPAEIRLYSMLHVRTSWPYGPNEDYPDLKYGNVWAWEYMSKLPCSVSIYGSNNMNDDASWEEVVSFSQDRELENSARWCARSDNNNKEYFIKSIQALAGAEPSCLKLTCSPSGKKFRYLKFVVNEIFKTTSEHESPMLGANDDKYVTLNEVEIFIAK